MSDMLTKYLIPLVAIVGFAGGSLFGVKALTKKCPPCEIKCPEIPDCSCPPVVSLQTFDPEKLNNKKGNFHLHNTLSDVTIVIEAKDSLLIKQLLRQAK